MRNPFLATVPTSTNVGPSKDLIDQALVVNSFCLMKVNEGETHCFLFYPFLNLVSLFDSVPHLII